MPCQRPSASSLALAPPPLAPSHRKAQYRRCRQGFQGRVLIVRGGMYLCIRALIRVFFLDSGLTVPTPSPSRRTHLMVLTENATYLEPLSPSLDPARRGGRGHAVGAPALLPTPTAGVEGVCPRRWALQGPCLHIDGLHAVYITRQWPWGVRAAVFANCGAGLPSAIDLLRSLPRACVCLLGDLLMMSVPQKPRPAAS
jgi:hypothetical protein